LSRRDALLATSDRCRKAGQLDVFTVPTELHLCRMPPSDPSPYRAIARGLRPSRRIRLTSRSHRG
jgi:hypothetical protein